VQHYMTSAVRMRKSLVTSSFVIKLLKVFVIGEIDGLLWYQYTIIYLNTTFNSLVYWNYRWKRIWYRRSCG